VADPCADVSCKLTEACALDERRRPVCRCGDVCDDDRHRQRHRALTVALAPVCGSDGRTYRNACAVSRYVCTTQHDVIIVYRGPCTLPVTGQYVQKAFYAFYKKRFTLLFVSRVTFIKFLKSFQKFIPRFYYKNIVNIFQRKAI